MYKKEYRPNKEYKNTNIPWFNQDRLNPLSLRVNNTSWFSLYATIEASASQSIPHNTNTKLTGLSIKNGDTAMTATANQITITQTWAYLITASCFAWWSSDLSFAIYKNWSFINPSFRSGTSSNWAITPSITTIANLSAWDNITMYFIQSSWTSQILQNAMLWVSKI
jgi:hypothetical protein